MEALIPSIGIFVKRDNTNNLALDFDESKMVERELSSYDHHSHLEEIKSVGKRPMLLAKHPKRNRNILIMW
jgi:hypothetical protein